MSHLHSTTSFTRKKYTHLSYHIPKEAAIKAYTHAQIKELQEWLNNYPRRVLGGLTTNEFKAKYHPDRMNLY